MPWGCKVAASHSVRIWHRAAGSAWLNWLPLRPERLSRQRGATLLIILIMVLLMAVLGSLALRSSIGGLKIATQSQIQALLLANSDAALFDIENPKLVARQLAQDGMFSYFEAAEHSQDQLVFCYRANTTVLFSLHQASVISSGKVNSRLGIKGFCRAKDYATARPVLLSQIYLQKNTQLAAPLSQLVQGSSLGQSALPNISQPISVTVISILPSFSKITAAQIEDCFKQSAALVSACFAEYNVPYNTQHADYIVAGHTIIQSAS